MPSDKTTAASRTILAAGMAKSPALQQLQQHQQELPSPAALLVGALGGAAALYDKDAYAALLRETVEASSFQSVHSVETALVPAGKRRGLLAGDEAAAAAAAAPKPSSALLERYKNTKCVRACALA
jgi:hypothetical protein